MKTETKLSFGGCMPTKQDHVDKLWGGFSNSETERLNQKAVSFPLLCSADTEKFQPFGDSDHKTTGWQMTPGQTLQQGTECSSIHSVADGQSRHSDLRHVLTCRRTLSEKSTISRPQCYQSRTWWKLNSVNLKIIHARCAGMSQHCKKPKQESHKIDPPELQQQDLVSKKVTETKYKTIQNGLSMKQGINCATHSYLNNRMYTHSCAYIYTHTHKTYAHTPICE